MDRELCRCLLLRGRGHLPGQQFVLTGIKENEAICLLPDGSKIHKLTLESRPKAPRPELGGRSFFDVTDGGFAWKKYMEAAGGVLLPGYQLRYIYFIDNPCAAI